MYLQHNNKLNNLGNLILYQKIQHFEVFTVFPKWFFDAVDVKSDSYCKHLALGSWREEKPAAEKITIWYKIRWRIEALVTMVLKKFGYIMIKQM